ncbi:putative dual specificity protein kinase YAK1 like protein [Nosema granulosis]|uniref:Dual specificity protein kinase YAK1 like protein n=1 Tax=Nosema granulosis TaxID=83296 RepID=A0A9P6H0K0_9MICR|nr:putative dual specificity protein kinase YAK1 like protein [Nosema granulosis]
MKNKIITDPSECHNSHYDNIEYNLIVSKGDIFVKNDIEKYMAIDMLGTGTFGQVVRCISKDGEEVAIKVVKNQPKYFYYEMNEVKILKTLKQKKLCKYFVEIKDVFTFREHLCIVEEMLGHNLYELLKITGFKGLDLDILHIISNQILEGINQLSLLGITHCDLKPENILIKNINTFEVKIIDFGSAFLAPQESNFYVQSRYYRAPEVILGIPYGSTCDIWSFGCIIYEMFMGCPLFPGKDNTDQIGKIVTFFGRLPRYMLEHGKNSHLYFEKENNYEVIVPSIGLTIRQFKNKLKSKVNSTKMDVDMFADFILMALNPNQLIRPTAANLLEHKYVKSPFEFVGDKLVEERNQPNPVPRAGKQRRFSEFNVEPTKKLRNIDMSRKRSLFDASNENKRNN